MAQAENDHQLLHAGFTHEPFALSGLTPYWWKLSAVAHCMLMRVCCRRREAAGSDADEDTEDGDEEDDGEEEARSGAEERQECIIS